jgi:hypothetical protein
MSDPLTILRQAQDDKDDKLRYQAEFMEVLIVF